MYRAAWRFDAGKHGGFKSRLCSPHTCVSQGLEGCVFCNGSVSEIEKLWAKF